MGGADSLPAGGRFPGGELRGGKRPAAPPLYTRLNGSNIQNMFALLIIAEERYFFYIDLTNISVENFIF